MVANPWLQWGFGGYGESDDEVEQDDDWESLLAELGAWMTKANPDGVWIAEVENFGWRSQSGKADFRAFKGDELLQHVLPKTDNHFKIFKRGKTLRIQNYHHDSPMGKEWYTVRAPTRKEQKEMDE